MYINPIFILGFWLTTFGIVALMSPYDPTKPRSLPALVRSAIVALGAFLLAYHFNLA